MREEEPRADEQPITLERDSFFRSIIRELSGTLEDVVGQEATAGFVSVVGGVVLLCNFLLLALFGAANFGLERAGTWEWILFVLLAASVIVQVGQMLPYTRVWKPDVRSAPRSVDPDSRLRSDVAFLLQQPASEAPPQGDIR